MNCPRAISPNLDIKYFRGQQNTLLAEPEQCQKPPSPLRSQTDCEKLTYWSQIVSSPGEIQYPRDISGNHLFRHEHGILRRPRCPGAGCVSIMMAVIHNIGIREAACSFDFHRGEIEQIKYTVSRQSSKSSESFSKYLDMRCIANSEQKCLHTSRC